MQKQRLEQRAQAGVEIKHRGLRALQGEGRVFFFFPVPVVGGFKRRAIVPRRRAPPRNQHYGVRHEKLFRGPGHAFPTVTHDGAPVAPRN